MKTPRDLDERTNVTGSGMEEAAGMNPPPPGRIRKFFANLGPGLIAGAADDDPSGISTYSVTGAAFGYMPLWTALFSFPLMVAVQLMCARLGLVTGRGLAGVVRRNYPRTVLWFACALLIVANVFNIGADLGGMALVPQRYLNRSAPDIRIFRVIENSGYLIRSPLIFNIFWPQICLSVAIPNI